MRFMNNCAEKEGGLCAELWCILQGLGYVHRPEYHGFTINKYGKEIWRVKVTVYSKSHLRGDRPYRFTVERETDKIGMQDAAREAIIRMGFHYRSALGRTAFRYFPYRKKGEVFSKFRSTEGEQDTTITHMASLIKAQDEAYVFMANEMERVYERLDVAERESSPN